MWNILSTDSPGRLSITILSLLSLLICGCSDDGEPRADDKGVIADITVMAPLSGFGDNGYYDEAFAGIMETSLAKGLEVSVLRPRNISEAEKYASEWADDESPDRRLLVLADSEYESLCQDMKPDDIHSVLLFESKGRNLPANVSSFRFARYGASYLSGCMAKESLGVHIVCPYEGSAENRDAIDGFQDGYRSINPVGDITVHYLADDCRGRSMPDSLYRLASRYPDDFFFPLARGSNSGLFKFSRESPFVLMLIAGMDVDCSLMSKRVPFSVVVNIREILSGYISRWDDGEDITGHRTFGMDDGSVSIMLSDMFYIVNDIWEEYYVNPFYWSDIYSQYFQEALKAEKEYEETGY